MEPIEGVLVHPGRFPRGRGAGAAGQRACRGSQADVVVSDMAPNLSGIESADAARIEHLVELALEFAQNHLKPEGALVAKVFHGSSYSQLVQALQGRPFGSVKPHQAQGLARPVVGNLSGRHGPEDSTGVNSLQLAVAERVQIRVSQCDLETPKMAQHSVQSATVLCVLYLELRLNNQWFSKIAVWLVIALVLFTVFKQFDRAAAAGAGYDGLLRLPGRSAQQAHQERHHSGRPGRHRDRRRHHRRPQASAPPPPTSTAAWSAT